MTRREQVEEDEAEGLQTYYTTDSRARQSHKVGSQQLRGEEVGRVIYPFAGLLLDAL